MMPDVDVQGGPDAPDDRSSLVRLMLEHATDGICLVGHDGRILACTPAIERLSGYSEAALLGRSGFDLLHPDDVQAAMERVALVGTEVDENWGTYRFLHADGHWVPVDLVANESPEPVAGSPEGALVLAVRDVSEQQAARQALDRSHRLQVLAARMAQRFVTATDAELDGAVRAALGDLVDHIGVDHAHLYRLTGDGHAMERIVSATRSVAPDHPVPAESRLAERLAIEDYPQWHERLAAREQVVLDTDARRRLGLSSSADALSVAVMPLAREGDLIGILVLDVVEEGFVFAAEDVSLGQLATDIIGSALARREATAAVEEAEQRFRALVEYSSDALIVIDADAVITHRPLGRQLFGYEPEQLVGMNALDLVHPEDLNFAAEEMLKAIADPDYHATNAMRIRHADGHWVPIELVASSRFDEPAINGVIMNVRDHTERESMAAALRTSEERLRNLIQNLPGMVFRCEATPPYRAEYVSETVLEVTGYPAAAMLCGDVDFDDLILPDHRRRTDEELAAAIRAGGNYVIEYPIRHRDGSVRWVSEHGRALVDEHGHAAHLEGLVFDITSRVEAERELSEHEASVASLVANVPGAVFRCEPEPPYRDMFISDAIEDLTGYRPDQLGDGFEYYDTILPGHRDAVDREIADALATHRPYVIEYQVCHRDGTRRWVEERGQGHYDDDGRIRWIDGAIMDQTVRKELEERLAHDAAHDPLTGLPNRTRLVEHLERTLLGHGDSRTLTAVLFVDLDRFKLVNDALGHTAGDELLVHFTRRLRSVLRDGDLAARPGGDEFVIVCSDLRHPDEAHRIADRVARILGDPFVVQGRSIFVTASIGIAFAEPASRAGDLLRHADAAVYRAKDRGRNRYEIFDDALRAETTAALEIETDLHRALDDHQLFVRYQPIVALADESLVGAEALIRWQHPRRGLLTPDQFLPAAEASGLIVAVGAEMLDLVAGALGDVPGTRLPHVSCNLSPRELAAPDLVTRIERTLREHAVDPARLTIEITENAVLDDLDIAVATLTAVRDLGLGIAIDDFGTGYSSLNYLRRLPVDTVKIDRTFTSELGRADADVTIVAGIVGLAHGLGKRVVAEGVETRHQADVLREVGCPYAQGYLFAPPLALDELLRTTLGRPAASDVRH